MISEEEIKNIAKLSYLKIKDSEIDKSRDNFSSILDYMKKLEELDVSIVEETSNLSKTDNVFRGDVGERKEEAEEVLKSFSKKRDNYLEVKKILYNED